MLAPRLARLAFPALGLALALAGLTGCGSAYQPGRGTTFDADASAHIDDEDIRKAYEARPQLPAEMHVAYYTFDPAAAKDLEATIRALPGVSSVYAIPPLMITGQRRFEENAWGQDREVTVKKLRLYAARAHTNVLIVADHGYKTGGVNGLAALNALLVPILFMPFEDNTVEGYAEAFVIDVRNGYLYGHVTEDDKRGPSFATIYAKDAKQIAGEQWETLRDALAKDLGRLLVDARTKDSGKATNVTVTPKPG
jgi:hypothetical protein